MFSSQIWSDVNPRLLA